MSGLVGVVGSRSAQTLLLAGLRQLSRKPHDSLGLCILSRRKLRIVKALGSLPALEAALPENPIAGSLGIAHTRWASHGAVTLENAHPHCDANQHIAIAHNGLLENTEELAASLTDSKLVSTTDSELIAHLVASSPGKNLSEKTTAAIAQLKGTFGLLIMSQDHPDCLIAVNHGSRLYVARDKESCLVSSDREVLAGYAQDVLELHDGEYALLRPGQIQIQSIPSPTNKPADSGNIHDLPQQIATEINQWPLAIRQTLNGRLDTRFVSARLDGLAMNARTLQSIRAVRFIGSGSSFHAARVGASMLEALSRLPAFAESAGEFLDRDPIIAADTLHIIISQSGETRDSLNVVNELNLHQAPVAAITNAIGSSIATATGGGVYLHAGPEEAVVATKSFGCSLAALALLSLYFARARDLGPSRAQPFYQALEALPDTVAQVLENKHDLQKAAKALKQARHAWICGSGVLLGTAAEGAQKFNELASLPAQAIAPTEIPHTCISGLQENTPVIWLLASEQEFSSRKHQIKMLATAGVTQILLTPSGESVNYPKTSTLPLPQTHPLLSCATHGAALQALALEAASEQRSHHPERLRKSITPDTGAATNAATQP